ncbi:MAG: DUF4340 domain-containing protein [Candidatus Eisenbacteria bacterium]|nr:DUF4340 domain-containing protein [Candidatus Eisenbacteria bacterium]
MNAFPVPRRGGQRALQGILLLASLVVLVALIRSWELERRPDEREAALRPLPPGAGAGIVGFTLARQGDTLRAVREEDRWRITKPVSDLASARMVRELFRNLEELQAARLLDTAERAPYGLDPPRMVLALEVARSWDTGPMVGPMVRIEIGDEAPGSSAYYAIWEGLPGVALLPGFVVQRFFLSDAFAWRERDILASTAPVDSVHISAAGMAPGSASVQVSARRESPERWTFRVPRKRSADALALERVTNGFWRSPFTGFFDDPAQRATLGLDPPAATWVLFRGREIDTLAIGRRLENGDMVVRVDGRPPGRVAGELYDLLTGGIAALESRRFVTGSGERVDRFLLATSDGGVFFSRGAKGWQRVPIPPARLAQLDRDAPPDTTLRSWQPVTDPSLEDDVGDLFELQGSAMPPPSGRAPAGEDYRLRIRLWGPEGFHQWILIAPFGGAISGRPQETGGMGAARLAGTAVGSAFPDRPMTFESELLFRMARRAGLPPR